MSFYYDEELPAGYQEADLQMAEYQDEARRHAALRAQGICTHSSWIGKDHDGNGPLPGGDYYPEQAGLKPGEQRCTAGCGAVFASEEAIHRAHVEVTR